MKTMMIVMLCAAALLVAGTVHAYAIYNHSDQKACITKWYDLFDCHVTVDPHSKHNGEHGAGLSDVWMSWQKDDNCYCTKKFSIPKGGYIKVYNHHFKIFSHGDKYEETRPIPQVHCSDIKKGSP